MIVTKPLIWCFIPVVVFLTSACEKHHHEDEGKADSSHPSEGEQGEEGHDHSEEHPDGHDHHEPGHGHGDAPVVGITLWNKRFELFAEYEGPVVNREFSIFLHITRLAEFQAQSVTPQSLIFRGPASVGAQEMERLGPGIFRIKLTFPQVGKYLGSLRIDGEDNGVVEEIPLEVFADVAGAQHAAGDEDDHGVIEFLKEQQWGVPFGTEFARAGKLVSSIEAAGRVETPPGGSSVVGAPLTGRLVPPPKGLLRPGTKVKKGQLLATLIPAPSSPEGEARARLAVAEAESRVAASTIALRRAERLIKDDAISEREYEDAAREADMAQSRLKAANQSAALFSQAKSGKGKGSWRIVAPISGTLVAVDARPGVTVSPGDPLFSIVDTSELWLVARVVEQDAARLVGNRNAAYQISGLSEWQPITIEGEDPPASVVTVGQTVDRITRTVNVIYSLHAQTSPDESSVSPLRVGGSLLMSLPAGKEFEGIILPSGALIDQEGRSVVYVQVDGEHFAERAVFVGPRAGGLVGILRGVREGERVVTRGAHLVRLADRARGGQAHGHVH